MKYYLLANPHSGGKNGQKALDQLLPYLDEKGYEYRLFKTSKPGEEADLLSQILSVLTESDRLIVIGGDGTISLVVDALPAEQAFAYNPAGSGNDFARSLQLSFDPIEAFLAIEKGQTHAIHVIKFSSEHLSGIALNNIGIGLDAQIVKSANASKFKLLLNKIGLGNLAYLFTALRVLFTKKPFVARVDRLVDGHLQLVKAFDKAFLMTFTKHPYFGGGIKISPQASNLTENIDLIEFDRLPLWKIFHALPEVLKGTHLTNPLFTYQIGQNFILTPGVAQPVQIDGETHEIQAGESLNLTTEQRNIIF